ncbi:MAG TPA: LUD domain-containing protein [Candidatus Eremiobacteraceae bacterium]
MSADARADILARIRAGLGMEARAELSEPPPIDATRTSPDVATRPDSCARFARELAAVGGEAIVLVEAGDAALARAVAERVARFDFRAVAVQRDSLALAAAAGIPAARLIQLSGASIDQLERADCAIVAAESLIADTGSAVVHVTAYEERLLPYLPPACIIVARASGVQVGLDEAALGAGEDERGERVFITGPSRTADIEKTVVLGAHGPGSLTVIIAAD